MIPILLFYTTVKYQLVCSYFRLHCWRNIYLHWKVNLFLRLKKNFHVHYCII